MAFETLLWVRKQSTGNCASRSVLRVIADHAGQDHSCYLRTRLIASETDLSEAGVRKALARLVDAGLVRIYDRYDRTGKRISNRYQVLVNGPGTPGPENEDYADVRGVTLSEVEGPLHEGEGQTLHEGEGLPHKEASSSEAPIVKGRAAAQKTATRLPDNFQPTEAMRAWFVDEKLGACIDGRVEHEKFVDYWAGVPGVKGRKLDWPATWRNWMRTAAERAERWPSRSGTALTPVSGAPYRPSTTDQRVGQALDIARKYEEQGL
jgi:hypothetical protein